MISLVTEVVTLHWRKPILQAKQLFSQFSPAKKKSISIGAENVMVDRRRQAQSKTLKKIWRLLGFSLMCVI